MCMLVVLRNLYCNVMALYTCSIVGCRVPFFLGREGRVAEVSGWLYKRGCGVEGRECGGEEGSGDSGDKTPAEQVNDKDDVWRGVGRWNEREGRGEEGKKEELREKEIRREGKTKDQEGGQ